MAADLDQAPEILSELADVRAVTLEELAARADELLGRILPPAAAQPVPVASFQSAI
jgi:FXSXX-COOH protein